MAANASNILADLNRSGIQKGNPALYQALKALLRDTNQIQQVIGIGVGGSGSSGGGSGIGGINQLTNDVLAGPGSGSQPALIAADAVTTSKIIDGAVTEAKQTLSDNTTWNVDTTKHGYFPKLPSGVPGVLLGYTSYNPGTTANISTTSTTFADIDATNLIITLTPPPSGKVLFELSAVAVVNSAAAAYVWNLRTTGGSNVTGSYHIVTSNTNQLAITVRFVLTGLIPGTSITYRWGHAVSSNTGSIRYGDDGTLSSRYGAAVMTAWAA